MATAKRKELMQVDEAKNFTLDPETVYSTLSAAVAIKVVHDQALAYGLDPADYKVRVEILCVEVAKPGSDSVYSAMLKLSRGNRNMVVQHSLSTGNLNTFSVQGAGRIDQATVFKRLFNVQSVAA